MTPYPQPTKSEKSTNFNVHLINFEIFLAKAVTKCLDSFTWNTFLSLLVYEDQTWALFCSTTKYFLENQWKQYNKKTWIQTRKLQIYIYSKCDSLGFR